MALKHNIYMERKPNSVKNKQGTDRHRGKNAHNYKSWIKSEK